MFFVPHVLHTRSKLLGLRLSHLLLSTSASRKTSGARPSGNPGLGSTNCSPICFMVATTKISYQPAIPCTVSMPNLLQVKEKKQSLGEQQGTRSSFSAGKKRNWHSCLYCLQGQSQFLAASYRVSSKLKGALLL